jgi:outer membrane protein OmpA-like peptidoglycan-associated protein
MRSFSVVQLDELLAQVKRDGLQIVGIRLVGHADRLNGTGSAEYNQRLSERRVGTVRDALIARGVDGALISTDAKGDGQQINRCDARFKSKAELEECLLPNRRVEVRIDARQR